MSTATVKTAEQHGGARRMTGARFIAETFKAYGVTHVFYLDAILRHGLIEMEEFGIERTLAHSEKAAADMADGDARAGRKPGVCMSQSVGAANLAAGLQDAFLARSPVIALTGRRPPMGRYRNAYQEIVHAPLFEPVTKYNVEVETVEQLPHLLRQAFREATTGAPAPVHLDLMEYIADSVERQEAEMEVWVEKPYTALPPHRTEPEPQAIEEAARLLQAARRPVIVSGGGANISGAGPQLTALAEALAIPVATSLDGKGTIMEDHPLSIGIPGTYSRWCANRVVYEADLVLYIGCRVSDQLTNHWRIPKPGTPIIQIDINPAEPGRNYPNTHAVVGDAKVCLQELLAALDDAKPANGWVEQAQQLVSEWHAELEERRRSDAAPILVERLCAELTQHLPADAVLVSDTGFSGIWTGTQVFLTHPGQSYLRCAGSLGWGFPAALGVKCAVGDRPVVCFTGDGGFWYHLCELETASRYGINTVTVVNNNSGLIQCAAGVARAYGDRDGDKERYYRFQSVNFARIAEDMGCRGIRVERPEEIGDALDTALAAERPVVVEVVTDPESTAPGPWTPE